MDIKLDNHIFLTSAYDLDQIFIPMKRFFGFTHFIYRRDYNDGSEIRLSNHPDWTEYFYKNNLHTQCGYHSHPKTFQKNIFYVHPLIVQNLFLNSA